MAEPHAAPAAPQRSGTKRPLSFEARAGISTPADDPDEPPAKKRRTDYDNPERGEKPGGVSSGVKLQTRATKRRRASVSDDAPTAEPGEEPTFSEPPAKRPRCSTEEEGTLQIDYDNPERGEKPGGVSSGVKLRTRATKRRRASVSDDAPTTEPGEEPTFSEPPAKRPRCSMEEEGTLQIVTAALRSLSLCHKTVPRLSTSQNGKQNIKPAPGSVLTLRPPMKERAGPESSTVEVSKMGRLFCSAEEGGEKVNYQKLLELGKEKDPGSRPNPEPTSFHKGSPPAKDSLEQDGAVKQALAGKQRGAPTSEDALLQVPLAPAGAKKSPAQAKTSPALDVKGKKVVRLRRIGKDFTVLTEAMEREVAAALGEGEPDEVMSSAFNLKVTREDIHTLRNVCWLNDEVVNFYMGLVMARSKKEGYPSVHAFRSLFYEKLASGGYKAVRRWTRRVDLFKKDIILVPINLSLHWALAVIDTRKKTVKYLDSLGQGGDEICETLLKYLQEASREKRNVELNVSEWTIHSMEPHEIPQQSHGSDCGVFTCKYADYISRDKPMTFTKIHVPYFREKMVWEILHQELL